MCRPVVSYFVALKRTLRALPYGILMGCLWGSLAFCVLWIGQNPSSWRHWILAPFGSLLISPFAMAFAALPALLVGVPVYSCLARAGWARKWSAAVLGAAAAALVGTPFGWPAAALCSFYGACIAYFLHLAYQAGANIPLKPKPLQGSA